MIDIVMATGKQLDELAEMMGLPPREGMNDPTYRIYLATKFKEPVTPLEKDIAVAAGEKLDEIGESLGIPRSISDDIQYRKRMLICIKNGFVPGPKVDPPRRLIPKGMDGTCGTVVDDLGARLKTMDQIFCVVRDKDGTSSVYWSGNMQGLAFAVLTLQDAALDALNGRI